MSEIDESNIWDASNQWIEAATLLGIGLRLSPPTKDMWATHYHLLVMCRAQFASELSYCRFTQSCESDELETIMRGYLDLHSFLVSAHLFWKTLDELAADFTLPDLAESIDKWSTIIDSTRSARNHIEHIDERIESGRNRAGDHMDATTFHRAMGRYSSGSATFGDETFDLHAIYDAICTIGREVATKLRALIDSGFKVRLTSK